jgi:hypothetical protein
MRLYVENWTTIITILLVGEVSRSGARAEGDSKAESTNRKNQTCLACWMETAIHFVYITRTIIASKSVQELSMAGDSLCEWVRFRFNLA